MKNCLISFLFCLLFLLFIPTHVYSAEMTNKMGGYEYVALKRNSSFFEQIKKEHTIYEIKYNYDLKGDTVRIPNNCILKFSGGSISNGGLIFENTVIESGYSNVFREISISGSIINTEVRLSWWELKYDPEYNDASLINQVIKAIDDCVLYYDILHDVYVGADKEDVTTGEIIHFVDKHNLKVIQTTEYYTVLRGRSKGGNVIRCADNKNISIDGLKVDGANVYYCEQGENGIGVTGNEKVIIENCIIRNCFSDCFGKDTNGKLLENGYPEWGAGGKGIQIEGGSVNTHVTVRNNLVKNCYIGISNNASDQECVIMDGNFIDSCYMSLVLLRLTEKIDMNVNINNSILSNNTGDVGAICMGNARNVSISNTQIKGENNIKSILRGCYSNCIIQLIVDQPCESLLDAALYRDNPEGHYAQNNYVRIVAAQKCDKIVTTSEIIPKRNGSSSVEYVGTVFDITLPQDGNKKMTVPSGISKDSSFTIRQGGMIYEYGK